MGDFVDRYGTYIAAIIVILLYLRHRNIQQHRVVRFNSVDDKYARAQHIQTILRRYGKVPEYDVFRHELDGTDMVEWADIKTLGAHADIDTIVKVLI